MASNSPLQSEFIPFPRQSQRKERKALKEKKRHLRRDQQKKGGVRGKKESIITSNVRLPVKRRSSKDVRKKERTEKK